MTFYSDLLIIFITKCKTTPNGYKLPKIYIIVNLINIFFSGFSTSALLGKRKHILKKVIEFLITTISGFSLKSILHLLNKSTERNPTVCNIYKITLNDLIIWFPLILFNSCNLLYFFYSPQFFCKPYHYKEYCTQRYRVHFSFKWFYKKLGELKRPYINGITYINIKRN